MRNRLGQNTISRLGRWAGVEASGDAIGMCLNCLGVTGKYYIRFWHMSKVNVAYQQLIRQLFELYNMFKVQMKHDNQ